MDTDFDHADNSGHLDHRERRTPRQCERGAEVLPRDRAPRAVLELIAGKWTMLTLVALADGCPVRFNELRRRLEGVTQKMLTQTLRALEREGLLTRTVFPTVPPRVEYRLTALGSEIAQLVTRIAEWSATHAEQLRAARASFDGRAPRPRPLSA
ncbi:helix-turn-helix domain-containing protein [Streptomyces sp. DSM 44915]|uniref:Helix-turn-helix domain-containing protein n=1 Tax=Streptomyces chisholmiae TaxID=3075540 RepID=A0ABU2JNG6_9ACTN|nr:helix-turn-helix domain-containing protein [Streptomyces sp. DSM 44915]MDT0266259.1 helix-turn-helix domain-containing protein [Streptomyces sp. DSM 44915]